MTRDRPEGMADFSRRPLVGAAIGFGAGAAAGGWCGVAAWMPAAAVAVLAALALAWRGFRGRWNPAGMRATCLAAIVVAGFFSGADARLRRIRRLDRMKPFHGSVVHVEATLAGIPEDRATGRAGVRIDFPARRIVLRRGEKTIRVRRLRIRWYGPDMRGDPDGGLGILPHPGERWSFTGKLLPPLRPGAFSTVGEPLLIAEAEAGTRLRKASPWNPGFVLTRLGARLRRGLTRGLKGREEAEAMLAAMLLGRRGDMEWDLTRSFRRSGTYHVFAISGLHVGILGLIGTGLLALASVPRKRWIFFLGPAVGLFVVISGARPSAVRAGLMVFFFLLGTALGKRSDGFCSLAAAALVLLGTRPLRVFDPGFLMSFTVVSGLLIMTRPVLRLLERGAFRRGDALDDLAAMAGLQPAPPGWVSGGLARRIARGGRAFALPLIAVSLSAWLTALPLSAYFFGRISLVGAPANLLMTPLAFLVVLCGALSLAGGVFWPGIGLIFNRINFGLTGGMASLARAVSDLPGAGIEVPSFPWWGVVAAEAILWRLAAGNFAWRKPEIEGMR